MPQAVYTADFSQFDRETAKAQQAVKKFTDEAVAAARDLEKLTKSFSGADIARQADQVAKAISAIGGATKLTADEQKKANATITEAIAKYHALGQDVPPEIAKLANEFKHLAEAEKRAAAELNPIAKNLEGVDTKVEATGASFLKLTGAVAIGNLLADGMKALGTAVLDTAKDTIKYADSLADLSAKTGMSTTGLQKLSFATEQSGVSLESVTQASTKLGAALVAGDKSVVGGLTKLGLSVTELRNLQPDQMFVKVADAIGKIADPMEKARRAQEIFGKQGLELLPALTGEMAKTVAAAAKLGIIISPETIANAAKLADQFDVLALQGRAFVAEALAPMVPLLSQMTQGISDVAGGVIENLKAAFSDPGILGAASSLKTAINDIFGTTQEERIKTITDLILGLAEAGVKTAEILVRAFSAVAGTLLWVASGYARLEQLDNAIKGKLGDKAAAEASVEWGKYADSLNTAQRKAYEIASGTSPLIQFFRDVKKEVAEARGEIGAFTREAIKPMMSRGLTTPPATGGGRTDPDAAAIAKTAAALKALNAERDKWSGQAAVDAAARFFVVMGDASTVSGAQAKAAFQIIDAGIKALVEDGKTVPPMWAEVHAKLGLVTMEMPKLVEWTNRYAESVAGAVSSADWSKVVPPPKLFPDLVEGLPKIGQLVGQSHPDWAKIPPPPKGFSLFGDPAQLGAQLTSTISGAILQAGKTDYAKLGGGIGGALGGSIGGNVAKTLAPALTKALGTTLGAAAGAAIPVLGQIGGELAGALLGKLFGPSQKEKTETARKDWIKSAGGLDVIKDAAERANVSTTGLMKASTEKGLTREIEKFNAALAESDKRIKKTIDSLGKLTTEGGLISKDLVTQLKQDSDQKDVQAALKQFQAAQSEKAVGGLGTFLTTTVPATKAGVDAIAASFTGLFGSLQQQGLSAAQALGVLAPPMDAFKVRLAEMGITAPAAFGEIARLADIAAGKITGPMIAGVSGLGQAMEGLHNTGLLTQEMFVGLASEVGATFKKLQDQGTGGKNAIALMQRPLQTIWELQQKFGYEVDETTQGVIDLALEGGQIGVQFLPAADRIAASIETLITKLDTLFTGMVTGAQTGSEGAKTAIERTLGGIRIPTIEVPIVARYEGFDDVPSASANVRPAAASSIEPRSMTVSTYLDGAVIAQNQIPHIARELTLVGV